MDTKECLEKLAEEGHRFYASSYTLVEMCNTICRKIVREKENKLIEPLNQYVDMYEDPEQKCRILISSIVSFLQEKLNINFVEVEDLYQFEPTEIGKLKIPYVFK
ncbi:hypothetical protein J7L70_00055, partial [Candidatus Bathyarchaeota archaeon]|nr:hypothetical protein [Candidatus Bathyarchaeota archaeon]